MLDFVGIHPFLRMVLQVVMSTMHFHIAQTGLRLETLFLPFRVSHRTSWHPLEIVLDVQGRSN